MRASGILMHITSLPSPYGIGTFGAGAQRFVDWLAAGGQKFWQVLPMGPTGYGNSPYQSFSTFAGNPLLIDLDDLCDSGLLTRKECEDAEFGADPHFVDFEKVSRSKFALLRQAYRSFQEDVGYLAFIGEEEAWLDDYALFMSIKQARGQKSWLTWERELRLRVPEAMDKARDEYVDEINFWKFLQYTFLRQWRKLRRYANSKGIRIIGDIPIYVSPDSANVWANPALFELDDDCKPVRVAGVPPDYFSKTGQLWGNPLYNWEAMKREDYLWWATRIRKAGDLFDVVRIDHFRAFDTYYAIPAYEKTAENGKWENGPGMAIFEAVRRQLGQNQPHIIAEDLGEIFDSTVKLLRESGYPGMKILQFAFNPNNEDSSFLPHNYARNCVAYPGTHDNNTTAGWYKTADKKTRRMARHYLKPLPFEPIPYAFMRSLYASAADTVIIPLQDILCLGEKARMNIPSTVGNNWIWRIKPGILSARKAKRLADLTQTYFR
jgi:4-alpha-glucanotransferase